MKKNTSFFSVTYLLWLGLFVIAPVVMILWQSFFFSSSLVLSSCGLMTVFSVVFELIFLICLCISCRFLVCSFSEILI